MIIALYYAWCKIGIKKEYFVEHDPQLVTGCGLWVAETWVTVQMPAAPIFTYFLSPPRSLDKLKVLFKSRSLNSSVKDQLVTKLSLE